MIQVIRIPVKYYLRRRDVIEVLAKIGISCQEVNKAIKNNVLVGERFTGPESRAYYRAQVVAEKFGLRFEVGEPASNGQSQQKATADCYIFSAPQAQQTMQPTEGK